MTTIFLSYRRADTIAYAGRLTEALERRFGHGSVFQDIEAIAPGSNFAEAIDAAIARCAVCVVLIGDSWIEERTEAGMRRLDDPHDFVRLEVSSALRKDTPVLPVLVEGARMPTENALPPELRPLARLQALEISDTRWDYDVERVANAIRRLAGGMSLQRSRRAVVFGAGGVLLAALAGFGAYRMLSRPPDVAGRWNLANGSFWTVLQDGRNVAIEETHYESKQVWKRGSGVLQDDRLDFALELVYDKGRYEGTLKLSPDRNTLSGDVRDVRRGRNESLALLRAR